MLNFVQRGYQTVSRFKENLFNDSSITLLSFSVSRITRTINSFRFHSKWRGSTDVVAGEVDKDSKVRKLQESSFHIFVPNCFWREKRKKKKTIRTNTISNDNKPWKGLKISGGVKAFLGEILTNQRVIANRGCILQFGIT